MKIMVLLCSMLMVNISYAQTIVQSKAHGSLSFIELEYGQAKVVAGTTEKQENSPTGTRGWLEDFQIIRQTDSIQIALKANFGVVYMVKAKDSVEIDIDIEWIYPEKIKNDKGEKFKSIRYNTKRPTNIPSASSYSLDAPYEMIKGNWKMNIYMENKKVYTKTFVLY